MTSGVYKQTIVTIVQITSSWKRGNNLEPRVICSTMKATRRSVAPAETMRDESSLMIIEEEEEAKSRERETKKNEIVAKVCLISKYY